MFTSFSIIIEAPGNPVSIRDFIGAWLHSGRLGAKISFPSSIIPAIPIEITLIF